MCRYVDILFVEISLWKLCTLPKSYSAAVFQQGGHIFLGVLDLGGVHPRQLHHVGWGQKAPLPPNLRRQLGQNHATARHKGRPLGQVALLESVSQMPEGKIYRQLFRHSLRHRFVADIF